MVYYFNTTKTLAIAVTVGFLTIHAFADEKKVLSPKSGTDVMGSKTLNAQNNNQGNSKIDTGGSKTMNAQSNGQKQQFTVKAQPAPAAQGEVKPPETTKERAPTTTKKKKSAKPKAKSKP